MLRAFAAWMAASVVAYAFKEPLFEFFIQPIGQLVFLTPGGAFSMYLKLALMVGLVLAMPVMAWQMWAFVSPALREHEFKAFFKYSFFSSALFLGGCVMGWWLVDPSVRYLMSFQSARLTPMITVEAYSGFVLMLVVGCGVICQMPMVFLWLSHLGLVSSYWLLEQWRVAVVACVVVAGVVTPSVDLVTQVLVACPMMVLYGISIVCVRIGEKRRTHIMVSSLS